MFMAAAHGAILGVFGVISKKVNTTGWPSNEILAEPHLPTSQHETHTLAYALSTIFKFFQLLSFALAPVQ